MNSFRPPPFVNFIHKVPFFLIDGFPQFDSKSLYPPIFNYLNIALERCQLFKTENTQKLLLLNFQSTKSPR